MSKTEQYPKDIDGLMKWLREQLPKQPSKRIIVLFHNELTDSTSATDDPQSLKDRGTCLKAALLKQMEIRKDFLSCGGLCSYSPGRGLDTISRSLVRRQVFERPLAAYTELPRMMGESMAACFRAAADEDPRIAEAEQRYIDRGIGEASFDSFGEYLQSVIPPGMNAVMGMLRVVRMKQQRPDYEFSQRVMLNTIPRIEDWANQSSPGFQTLLRSVAMIQGLYPEFNLHDPQRYLAIDWDGENPRLDFSPDIIRWAINEGWPTRIKDREYFNPCGGLSMRCGHFSAVADSVRWMMEIMKHLWECQWPDTEEDALTALHFSMSNPRRVQRRYMQSGFGMEFLEEFESPTHFDVSDVLGLALMDLLFDMDGPIDFGDQDWM
jgi:hypothetical protein